MKMERVLKKKNKNNFHSEMCQILYLKFVKHTRATEKIRKTL
jgi:hypothetical protein